MVGSWFIQQDSSGQTACLTTTQFNPTAYFLLLSSILFQMRKFPTSGLAVRINVILGV